MINPDKLHSHLHGVDVNRGSGYEPIVINGVVIEKDSFSVPYPNGFHYMSMDEVPETLRDVSSHGFNVWDSPAMKAIGNKSNDSSSLNTSEKDQTDAGG